MHNKMFHDGVRRPPSAGWLRACLALILSFVAQFALASAPTCSSAAPQAATVAVNATTQRVYAYGVQQATSVLFPTWWLPGHQADIQWLPGVNAGGGTWYADVPLAQFDSGNPRYGDFKTDVYMSSSGYTNVFCAHTFWSWTFPSPSVTSFSPNNGPTYSPVTIYGNNFSSTFAEDQVTFNGQPAAVTAASATQLTVAVPAGATSGPITLTINGQTVNVGYFTLSPFTYDGTKWLNACQVNDPKLLYVLQSEAFMVQRSIMTQHTDGSWAITWQPYTQNGGVTYDPSSLFYGEPQAAAGRSAFLIGPKLVMGAPHGPGGSAPGSFNPADWAIVFGATPSLVNGSGYQTYVCQFPDLSNIPAANVFLPDSTKPVYNTWSATDPNHDYVAFYLTQAPNRPYVRLRHSGSAYPGDPAADFGHPDHLTTKISPADEMFGRDVGGHDLINGGHYLGGSSGSMIYNLAHDYVEDVVAESGYGCVVFTLVNGGPNKTLSASCATSLNYTVNYPVADIAAGIPAYALITAPQSDVLEQIPVGGTASATYTITAPSTASAPISWHIAAPTGLPSGAPTITFAPTTTSGTLPLGTSYQFTANVGAANTCGKYDETIKVYDNTNGFADSLTHHIEVGVTEFSVAPNDGFVLQKAVPPYNGTSKTYTLSNPRPTAVTVHVSSSFWVDLGYQQNGRARLPSPTPIDITLGAAGSATATATVTISIDETAAEGFSVGTTYTANVTFANKSSTCAVTTSTTRAVSFTPGVQEYVRFDSTLPPIYSGTTNEVLNIADNFVIAGASVDVSIFDFPQSYDAFDFAFETIVLITPTGTRLTLWNNNGTPTGNYYSLDYNTSLTDMVGTLHIDDATAPSPLGTHLSVLDGQNAAGNWTLEITGSGGGAYFVQWGLRLKVQPACSGNICTM